MVSLPRFRARIRFGPDKGKYIQVGFKPCGPRETAAIHTEIQWRELDARNAMKAALIAPFVCKDPKPQPSFDEFLELEPE